jgi:type IV secretion system protein VirB6
VSGCPAFAASGPTGIADALDKVDCLASDATSLSFARLFGDNGSFRSALTILLTLYVAFLAINLLTGRSTLRLSSLTPRMMTMGLVITFVTSWVAYQSVIWNLAVGAPDEIATVLVGSKTSATVLFAQRLDVFFDTISEAARAYPVVAQGAVSAVPAGPFVSPTNLLSLAAIILLLSTAGVLIACRLALAALLILGPVFIVLALFEGTRGLFEGWLKSVAMLAFIPLLTVLLGSGALLALDPMIASLGSGGEITLRLAVTILVAAIIYLTLMMLAFKMAGSLTSAWQLGKSSSSPPAYATSDESHGPSLLAGSQQISTTPTAAGSDRVRKAVASLGMISSPEYSMTTRTAAPAQSFPHLVALKAPSILADGRDNYVTHRVHSTRSTLRQGILK